VESFFYKIAVVLKFILGRLFYVFGLLCLLIFLIFLGIGFFPPFGWAREAGGNPFAIMMGNFFEFVIFFTGFASGFFYKDGEGRRQFMRAFLWTACLAYGIKYAANSTFLGERPCGGRGSFPSGHTSISFQGAFFLWKRYGWKWTPVFILAILTSSSRIIGLYHHWRDIVVGLVIALAMNGLCVTPRGKCR
jgi:membrane-associated phospholipid phosphatase